MAYTKGPMANLPPLLLEHDPTRIAPVVGRPCLAFDSSLTGLAVAAMSYKGAISVAEYGSAHVESVRGRVGRLVELTNNAVSGALIAMRSHGRAFSEEPPCLVLIEGYSHASKHQAHQLGELGFSLRETVLKYIGPAVPVLEIAPPSLKRWAAGKGNVDKAVVASHLSARFGVTFRSNNESDAYGLLRLAELILWAMDAGDHPTPDIKPPKWSTATMREIACEYAIVARDPSAARPKKPKKKARKMSVAEKARAITQALRE